jgi:protein-S-isoprenylcysteine O-methyltransferase Ste14
MVMQRAFKNYRLKSFLGFEPEESRLRTGGALAWVRHPIYTGVLLAAFGLVVLGASGAHILGWLVLFVVLSAKASGEEKMLAERHPGYVSYASTTGRLIPKFFHP